MELDVVSKLQKYGILRGQDFPSLPSHEILALFENLIAVYDSNLSFSASEFSSKTHKQLTSAMRIMELGHKVPPKDAFLEKKHECLVRSLSSIIDRLERKFGEDIVQSKLRKHIGVLKDSRSVKERKEPFVDSRMCVADGFVSTTQLARTPVAPRRQDRIGVSNDGKENTEHDPKQLGTQKSPHSKLSSVLEDETVFCSTKQLPRTPVQLNVSANQKSNIESTPLASVPIVKKRPCSVSGTSQATPVTPSPLRLVSSHAHLPSALNPLPVDRSDSSERFDAFVTRSKLFHTPVKTSLEKEASCTSLASLSKRDQPQNIIVPDTEADNSHHDSCLPTFERLTEFNKPNPHRQTREDISSKPLRGINSSLQWSPIPQPLSKHHSSNSTRPHVRKTLRKKQDLEFSRVEEVADRSLSVDQESTNSNENHCAASCRTDVEPRAGTESMTESLSGLDQELSRNEDSRLVHAETERRRRARAQRMDELRKKIDAACVGQKIESLKLQEMMELHSQSRSEHETALLIQEMIDAQGGHLQKIQAQFSKLSLDDGRKQSSALDVQTRVDVDRKMQRVQSYIGRWKALQRSSLNLERW